MVETRKLMQKKSDGTDEQYYPETHVAAVLGLMELFNTYRAQGGGQSAVISANGKTGAVLITQSDLGLFPATSATDGLLSKEMYQKLQDLADNPVKSELSVEALEDDIFKMLYQGDQFYPQTVISAVEGLDEALTESGIKGEKGEPGPQGPPGTAENLTTATEQADGLMSAADKTQLTRLSKYEFVKTGEA